MDLDKLAEILDGDDVSSAEVTTFHVTKDGNVLRKVVRIEYHQDGDYQWSSSVYPIHVE